MIIVRVHMFQNYYEDTYFINFIVAEISYQKMRNPAQMVENSYIRTSKRYKNT